VNLRVEHCARRSGSGGYRRLGRGLSGFLH
jgi:hypothetical protein